MYTGATVYVYYGKLILGAFSFVLGGIIMFCFHKYGPVDSNQYQTCTKCGRVRVAACPHRWDTIKTLEEMSSGRKVGEIWVLQCNRCGEIIQKGIR